MQGVHLKFYTYESQKHQGILLYEWLLECAKKHSIQGGSAFRAIAGYGHHGILHEERFFELASDVPVQIEFIADEDTLSQFLSFLKTEKIKLFYTKAPIEYGTLNS